MEFKSIGIGFEFNLIWRGETKIDAKSIENLLAISNLCDYGVGKKVCYEKTQTHIWECIFSFHLEKILHHKFILVGWNSVRSYSCPP